MRNKRELHGTSLRRLLPVVPDLLQQIRFPDLFVITASTDETQAHAALKQRDFRSASRHTLVSCVRIILTGCSPSLIPPSLSSALISVLGQQFDHIFELWACLVPLLRQLPSDAHLAFGTFCKFLQSNMNHDITDSHFACVFGPPLLNFRRKKVGLLGYSAAAVFELLISQSHRVFNLPPLSFGDSTSNLSRRMSLASLATLKLTLRSFLLWRNESVSKADKYFRYQSFQDIRKSVESNYTVLPIGWEVVQTSEAQDEYVPVLQEFYQVEKVYNGRMKYLDTFIQQVFEKRPQGVSEAELDEMFGAEGEHIRSVYELSCKLLAKLDKFRLEFEFSSQEEYGPAGRVGFIVRVFEDLMAEGDLDCLSRYTKNQVQRTKVLQSKKPITSRFSFKRNKGLGFFEMWSVFRAQMQTEAPESLTQGFSMEIGSILAQPFQRLFKYLPMLEVLHKETSRKHPARSELKSLIEKLKVMSQKTNVEMKDNLEF